MEFFTVSTKGVDGTNSVAQMLGARLRQGDVVLLKGGLASGKTTFVKAAAQALGSASVVTSPTFALAQFYTSDRGTILHIDAYRLSGIHEFRDLGLDEYIDDSITLVEWGDKVASDFPAALTIEFTYDPSAPELRLLTFSAHGERMARVIDALFAEQRTA